MESPVTVLALRNMLAVEITAGDTSSLAAAQVATVNLVRAHGISEFTVYRVRKEITAKYRKKVS